ncbi:organic solute transporter subunit alpha-like [Patiria miniata]|uniref:Uncharacterized protein n=1 Tax=Patiria miniata TaxID=46514 RepID=A0A914BDC3_PATMI|nr:organic solute transporter subunit alpha-like [Patiria miniata]
MDEATTFAPNDSGHREFDCSFDPRAAEIFANISENPELLAVIIIGTVLTIGQIISLVEGCTWIAKNIPHSERSTCLIWMFSCWPVFSIVSLVGLYIPRAALLSNIASNMFLYPTMYHFLLLIVDYFGGEDSLIGKMRGHLMHFNQPPLLCCCCCCPKAFCHNKLTKKKYLFLEIVVMQVAVARPIMQFLTLMFDLDGTYPYPSYDPRSPHVYLLVLNTISTMSSMQSILIIYNSAKPAIKDLGGYNTLPKFILLESFVLVSGLQMSIIGFAIGGVPCSKPFPFMSRGSSWNAFITILWGIIFQPVSIKYLRTLKGNVISLPSKFRDDKKSTNLPGLIARAKERLQRGGEVSIDEEAAEASEAEERTPLRRRRYSTGCVDDGTSYGTVHGSVLEV